MKYRSWLLYIPAGLIEIHPHVNIILLPLTGLEILPWTKMLTWSADRRTFTCTYVWTTWTLYIPDRPRRRGHNKNINIRSCVLTKKARKWSQGRVTIKDGIPPSQRERGVKHGPRNRRPPRRPAPSPPSEVITHNARQNNANIRASSRENLSSVPV